MNRIQRPVVGSIPLAHQHHLPYWEVGKADRRLKNPGSVFLGTWLNVWKRVRYDLWALKKRRGLELYLIVWGKDPVHDRQKLPLELACGAKCPDDNYHLSKAQENSEAFDEARRLYRMHVDAA